MIHTQKHYRDGLSKLGIGELEEQLFISQNFKNKNEYTIERNRQNSKIVLDYIINEIKLLNTITINFFMVCFSHLQ